MATYTVVFDGSWQGDFESLHVAHEWARALGEKSGRIAYLTIRRGQHLNLVTALPERRAREGRERWTHEARRWRPIPEAEAAAPSGGQERLPVPARAG